MYLLIESASPPVMSALLFKGLEKYNLPLATLLTHRVCVCVCVCVCVRERERERQRQRERHRERGRSTDGEAGKVY